MVDSRGAGSGGGVLPARGSHRIAGGSRSGDGTVFLRVLLACAVVVSVVFLLGRLVATSRRSVMLLLAIQCRRLSRSGVRVDPDAPVVSGSVVVFEEPEGWRNPGRTA